MKTSDKYEYKLLVDYLWLSSCIKIEYSKGPSMEPCGTPRLTGKSSDRVHPHKLVGISKSDKLRASSQHFLQTHIF